MIKEPIEIYKCSQCEQYYLPNHIKHLVDGVFCIYCRPMEEGDDADLKYETQRDMGDENDNV